MNVPDIMVAASGPEILSDFSDSTSLLHLSRLNSILDWYLTSNETTGIYNRRAGDLCYYSDCCDALADFERRFLSVEQHAPIRQQGRRAVQYTLVGNRDINSLIALSSFEVTNSVVIQGDTAGHMASISLKPSHDVVQSFSGNANLAGVPAAMQKQAAANASVTPLTVTTFSTNNSSSDTTAISNTVLPFDHDSSLYYLSLPQPDPVSVDPQLTLALAWFGRSRALKLEQVYT